VSTGYSGASGSGTAIPSQEELDAVVGDIRTAMASLRESNRTADENITEATLDLVRSGRKVAGLELPKPWLDALEIIRRAASLLQLVPLEAAGLLSGHAKLVREATEAIDHAIRSLED